MPKHTQFDPVALSAVKPGMDDALGVVGARLTEYFDNPEPNAAALRAARDELHRVVGAFRVISLDGAAVYCAEIEKVLDELGTNPALASALFQSELKRALSGLQRYLDALMSGADNTVLSLFPKYAALQSLRGMEMSFEQDLFFPSLAIQLPESVLDNLPPANWQAKLKEAQSKYQRGLMKLWRDPGARSELLVMQGALDVISDCVPQDQSRAFWWVANALLECVHLGGVPIDLGTRKLLVKIDQRMRATTKNKLLDAGPVMNEMLYLVGRSTVAGDLAGQVRESYVLDRYLPDFEVTPTLADKKSLDELREQLHEVEENWEHCVAGDSNACGRFVAYLEKVAKKSDGLKSRQPQHLVRQVNALSEYLRDPEYARLIGEDMAMTMLQWRSGVENPATLDTRFQEHARLLSEQIASTVHPDEADVQRMATLIGLYNQAEHSQVTSTLAQEMLVNLEQVEQALNTFFEDAEQRNQLTKLPNLLSQIHGGLRILELDQAEKLLQTVWLHVLDYVGTQKIPKLDEIHAVAGAMATLDGYLRDMSYGESEQTESLTQALADLSGTGSGVASGSYAKFPQSTVANQRPMPDVQHPLDEDMELLGVFLEEANEVLGIMQINLEFCQIQVESEEPLVTIRRGFHTLKGSGRMVGLTDLGEVAWVAERALNKWLQTKKHASAALLNFIEQAIKDFSGWIVELERKGCVRIQADELLEMARQIEAGMMTESTTSTEVNAAEEMPVELPPAELPAAPELSAESEPAGDFQEPDSIIIGTLALSPTLFKIASEEATQHIQSMRQHLEVMHQQHPPVVDYNFMRAAHTLAGVCRNTGFTAVVQLAAALEGFLQACLDKPLNLTVEQLQMVDEVVAVLGEMVDKVCGKIMPDSRVDLVQCVLNEKERVQHEAEQLRPLVEEISHDEQAQAVVSQELPTEMPLKPLSAEEPVQKTLLRDDVDPQLLPVFIEEADELCPKIGDCLRSLRENAEDDHALQLLNRLLHTLKGSARMTGAMRIGELAHAMEGNLQAGVKAGGEALLDKLEADYDHINILLEELRTGEVQPEALHQDAQHIGMDGKAAGDDKHGDRRSEQRATHVAAERVQPGSVLRVRSEVVDRLVNQAGEISVARSRMETELQAFKDGLLELSGSVARLRKQLREVEIQAESQIQARISLANESNEQFDPLEFDRFTRLQELTRFMNESVHDVQTVQHSLLRNLDETASAITAQGRLNRDLQQSLMNVRMVPFGSMTERLYRIVRQTGKELGKRANLELTGTGVELDRSVLERMTAPFEHLLRNAIAHGLEDEALRIANGKDAIGEVRLDLRQESNEVVFEFSDDGKGLDFEALRAKAIEKGLLSEADEAVTHEQLAQLIFTSGVSTANEVTEVAGRGIGMDVVRSEIAALGGRIDVSSRAGLGTTFTIHLPLTLAVTHVLMVRAGESVYAFPSTMVEQVRQVKPAELKEVYAARKVTWQGKDYPFHYLPTLLGDAGRAPESLPHNPMILLRSGEQRIALHVDGLLGNREAVVKNIGPQLTRLPDMAGATVMGDGSIVLILNPVQMAQRIVAARKSTESTDVAAAVVQAEPVVINVRPLVMVVDDSLTVRKITTRMLTRAGYQVVTAKDGVDALEQLGEVSPNIMLLDIEMPRMDGFELTKLMRRDEKTRALPIIMITSRTADKHRDHAMELGVNGYMGKPYQEEELLAQIAALIAA
ncbi:MAG: Hpt domain-containing protein [Gallionella sp.]|nr:Hpt domain-containing protein [Gallionella sp.]